MKWSRILDSVPAFELSTANCRSCSPTSAKRSCQKVWSFHPDSDESRVRNAPARPSGSPWQKVNLRLMLRCLKPEGSLAGPFFYVEKIMISTNGEFMEEFECMTGKNRGRGLEYFGGIGGFKPVIGLANDYIQGPETREIDFLAIEVFPLGIRLGPRGCKDREVGWWRFSGAPFTSLLTSWFNKYWNPLIQFISIDYVPLSHSDWRAWETISFFDQNFVPGTTSHHWIHFPEVHIEPFPSSNVLPCRARTKLRPTKCLSCLRTGTACEHVSQRYGAGSQTWDRQKSEVRHGF